MSSPAGSTAGSTSVEHQVRLKPNLQESELPVGPVSAGSSVQTACPYCGVGCGISAEIKDRAARVVRIEGDAAHPANGGRLCAKGTALGETLGFEDRLLRPRIGKKEVFWGEALDAIAAAILRIRAEHGPDALAIYASGQLLTEDYYVANKLVKGFLGTANIDTNSRLCMASTVVAQQRAFGEDAVPGCYEDLELADLVILSGSNTAWCHPVLYQRIKAARTARGTKVVVIDPRRTATCEIADLHLPIRPGSDSALFNGLLAFLADHGALDAVYVATHTAGFDAALASARTDAGSIETLAVRCGVPAADLLIFFRWFMQTPRTVTAWSQGVNQSSGGTDKVNAIINCHLATGRVGKPGASPLSLTGQPNAMGGREVGGLATQLAAHLSFDEPADRTLLARFWQAPALPVQRGLKAVDMFEAVADGRIKFLWILGTNPAVSLPNAERVRAAIAQCEFVVVSDCVSDNDTLRHAHVALPAQAWGEKEGTVTNSERCVSRQRALVSPAGEARPDWWALAQVARRLGFVRNFSWAHAADIFREHAALSALANPAKTHRQFDLGALASIDQAGYDGLTPFSWPWRAGTEPQARLFADGQFAHPDGRARFVAIAHHAPANAPGGDFPFVLNTGRVRDQWHTMTRTGVVPRLNRHRDEPFVEIHPDDAARVGVIDGGLARVSTPQASALLRVCVTDTQRPGALFAPMHWTRTLTVGGIVGALPNAVVDPHSGQPELKHTPAAIVPVPVAATAVVLSRTPSLAPAADYAVRRRERFGFQLDAARTVRPASLLAWLRELMPAGLEGEWQQAEAGDNAALLCVRAGQVEAVALASTGAAVSLVTARQLMAQGVTDDVLRTALFAFASETTAPSRSRTVCACFELDEDVLRAAGKHCASLDDLCTATKAGTRCGTCLPELSVYVGNRATARIPLLTL